MHSLAAFPAFEYQFTKHKGKTYIWDIIRKKNVLITPEEWVRQHLVHFLVSKNYPTSLISLEKRHYYNQLAKRTDVLVLDREGSPFLLAECKAPDVLLDNEAFYQLMVYQKTLNSPYLLLTNGMQSYFFECQAGGYTPLESLPLYHLPNE